MTSPLNDSVTSDISNHGGNSNMLYINYCGHFYCINHRSWERSSLETIKCINLLYLT